MTPSIYHTITGRKFDLNNLDKKEKRFLSLVLQKYHSKPEWSEFASWWLRQFDGSKLDDTSPLYRICQDLEARLGIAQEKVSLPDLLDYLADLIEEKYGSRYKFCKEVSLDQGYLSRVLSGRTGLSLGALRKLLEKLDCAIVVRRGQDLRADVKHEEPSRPLAPVRFRRAHAGTVLEGRGKRWVARQ